jgi:hypothetical protein
MIELKKDAPKTRWGLMLKLFIGTVVAPIVILSLAIWRTQPPPEQPKVQINIITQAIPEPRFFDYAKIDEAIGVGYLDRKKNNEGEVWHNTVMASTVSIVGAPDKVTKVGMMFLGNAPEDMMVANLFAVRQLSIALTGDESVVVWMVNAMDKKLSSTSDDFNGAKVIFNEVPAPNGSIIFLSFTPQQNPV